MAAKIDGERFFDASKMASEIAAAQYGVASRFLMPSAVLLSSYVNVIQPEATRLAAISSEALSVFLSRALRVALQFALPFALGAILLARPALVWLFGAGYGDAAVTLSLLVVSVLLVPLLLVL